ncbi:MAG: TIGR03986 family CRISPR-associated RAMP protein, partial [Gammaproteobacteria bacterium]
MNSKQNAPARPPARSNDAPYNFVPLSRNVLDPEWAALVSHDLPMKDGVSGELTVEICAQTPLLVGGRQVKASSKLPGEVHFFESPDGYSIPGSSLRGMIRNVFEIATFSKMSQVDDVRFGLRDISGGRVSESYKDFFVPKGRGPSAGKSLRKRMYGFMSLGEDGGPQITPCEMARLHKNDISKWLGFAQEAFFRSGQSVDQKYAHYTECVKKAGKGPWEEIRFDMDPATRMAGNLGSGKLTGFPVFTGQISDNKKKDFIFFNTNEDRAFSVHETCDSAWRDFLFIHGDDTDDKGMSWPGHWKDVFYAGGRVPVFYMQNQRRLQIALAFLPKLASDFSVHDTIRHGGRSHTDEGMTDMTELLFGRVGETSESAIKSRVWFEMATLVGKAKPMTLAPTILNGPKASYFPHYLEQDTVRRRDGQYATYMDTPSNRRPVARGWKRYPARTDYEIQALSGDQKKNTNVQVILNPLETGARFRSRIVFHNVTPVELGALLWSITFGNNHECRHGLGMGKSF